MTTSLSWQSSTNCTLPSGTYFRLAADREARQFGHKPVSGYGWRYSNASRYVRMFQSRRSLLVWKIFGERLDGWTNDDLPTETVPGDAKHAAVEGQADREHVAPSQPGRSGLHRQRHASARGGRGKLCRPDGKKIKVAPLTDEDRLTIVRWIDLGCPIDLHFDPENPERETYGWMCDDNRPTLTLTYPKAGANPAPDSRASSSA